VSTSRGPEAGERRQARERALHLLYEAEVKGESAEEVLAALPLPPTDYARRLFTGAAERGGEIDGLIRAHASGWALERMPAVDRQLLRLATYELLAEPGVPLAVVLDEAVELAKQYSTEDSGRYVNGVLAAIAVETRPGEAESHPAGETGPAPRLAPGALGGVRARPSA